MMKSKKNRNVCLFIIKEVSLFLIFKYIITRKIINLLEDCSIIVMMVVGSVFVTIICEDGISKVSG